MMATLHPQQTQIQEAHSTTNHLTMAGPQITGMEDSEVSMDTDKKAIYRHPLFPLMALLFEKCEQATQTADCPSSESFDVDIQAFVQHQEVDRKPFFSDDSELDNLMVKAIQVLRIHLLELEKVNDLCKDFCNRYISCLKGKLQSENLLRSEGVPGGMDTPTGIISPVIGGTSNVIQGNAASSSGQVNLGQGQIVSNGTVYQMVQTPQGLVAQPLQIQQQQQQQPPQVPTTTATIVHGSTPLSQIGGQNIQANIVNTGSSNLLTLAVNLSDDEDDPTGKKKSKRGILPKQATQVMKSWLFQHIVHPYPTEDEKRQIAMQTNLSLLQVNNWFINARRRILQPMLDASNPEQAKTKKSKPQANRPVQRFWPASIANNAKQAQVNADNETSSIEGTDLETEDLTASKDNPDV